MFTLHYHVFLQRLALAQALHCQCLLKIVAVRCNPSVRIKTRFLNAASSLDRSFVATHVLAICVLATRVLATNVRTVAPIATLHPRIARSSLPRIVCAQQRSMNAWHNKVLRAARCIRRIVAATQNIPPELIWSHCFKFAFYSLVFHRLFTVFRSHSSTEHLHLICWHALHRDISTRIIQI